MGLDEIQTESSPSVCSGQQSYSGVPKSATGAVTHHMQKASNVKPEGSSVKYAINLATSHQYASKKAKANTLLIPFMQGN